MAFNHVPYLLILPEVRALEASCSGKLGEPVIVLKVCGIGLSYAILVRETMHLELFKFWEEMFVHEFYGAKHIDCLDRRPKVLTHVKFQALIQVKNPQVDDCKTRNRRILDRDYLGETT